CVDAVLTGKSANAFAVVRPPGHHATVDEPYGFCLFNNVAVAAQYAIDKHKLQRVLILDWDVHHGNGIQQAFYEDPRILYVSLHRYDNGTFFPIHSDSDYHNVGKKAGVGFNVNIPWSNAQMGDREYMAAFAKIVMPIAYEFAPELVFVSAGFDAAMGDPLGRYLLTPSGYSCMTHLLSGLANGKVV
uniref:Histone deacetylase domain-containing protein n=1 Tax=Plectus sambesii TaxID=2011161 RepID=A0A914UW51_9BILA